MGVQPMRTGSATAIVWSWESWYTAAWSDFRKQSQLHQKSNVAVDYYWFGYQPFESCREVIAISTPTSDQRNLTKMPHRRCTPTVQSYLPGCTNVQPNLLMFPWTHPSLHSKRHLNLFSYFCTAHGRVSLYFTTGPCEWGI